MRSGLKNKLSGFWLSIVMPCERSTFLISKGQHEKLSAGERVKIRIHLFTCRACRSFAKQINYLSIGINKMNNELKKGADLFKLSEGEKSQIHQKIRDELKK
jgi:hypothetical protein